jgi:hypothetical protein
MQTHVCNTEVCPVLGYYTASSGNYVPTFWDNLAIPSSGVKKSFWTFFTFEDGDREQDMVMWLFFSSGKDPAEDATDAPQPCGLLCNPMMKMMMIIIFCPFPSNEAPVE